MRQFVAFAFVAALLILIGCAGANLAGTYRADVRLIEGRQESTEPGCSLAEVNAKLRQNPRTLTLGSDSRYRLQSAEFVEEGSWNVEESVLLLRGDVSNGIAIRPALQKDRRWRLGDDGEIVNEGSYGHYNLEEVYLPD
jgi:hypothetical protein